MKHTYTTTIRLDDETCQRVKQHAKELGISINELIIIALSLSLPLDVADVAYYHYWKTLGKDENNNDN